MKKNYSLNIILILIFFQMGLNAQTVADGYYKLINNYGTNLALNVEIDDNVNKETWSDAMAQKWQLIHIGSGYYKVISLENSKALRCVGIGNGSNVDVAPYSDSDEFKWFIEDCGGGNYELGRMNTSPRQNLEAWPDASGTNAGSYRDADDAWMRWQIVSVSLSPDFETTGSGSITSSSVELEGTVNSEGSTSITEKGFCYKTTNNVTITDNSTTFTATGTGLYNLVINSLSANTTYYYRAYIVDGAGDYLADNELSFKTLAAEPSITSLDNADLFSMDITINTNGNPEGTEFLIANSAETQYIDVNGQLSAIPVWVDSWPTTFTISGLDADTEYSFKIKARRSSDNTETAFSSPVTLSTTNAPRVNSVDNDGETIILHYNDYTGYAIRVQYKESGGSVFEDLPGTFITINPTSAEISGLEPDLVYVFRLVVTVSASDKFSDPTANQPVGIEPPIIIRASMRLGTRQIRIEFSKDIDIQSLTPPLTSYFSVWYNSQEINVTQVNEGSLILSLEDEIEESGNLVITTNTNIPAADSNTPPLSMGAFNTYFQSGNAIIFQAAVPLSSWSIIVAFLAIILSLFISKKTL